jgi:hypothetical protein
VLLSDRFPGAPLIRGPSSGTCGVPDCALEAQRLRDDRERMGASRLLSRAAIKGARVIELSNKALRNGRLAGKRFAVLPWGLR